MTDIEQIILEGLDKQGVLCQLKAQMRASVYKLIDSQERQAKGKTDFNWENSKASQLAKNPQMKQIIEIFIEFLQFFNLHYSLSVFKQELNSDYDIKRDSLLQKLNLKKTDIPSDQSILQFIINDYFGGSRKTQPPSSFFLQKDQNQEQEKPEIKLSGQENKQPVKIEKDVKQMKKQEPKTKFEIKPIVDKKDSALPGKNLPPLGGLGGLGTIKQPQQQQQQQPKNQAYDFDIGFDDSDDSNKNIAQVQPPAAKFNTINNKQQQQQQQQQQKQQQQNNQWIKNDKKDESISYEEEISEAIQDYEDDTFENPSKASGGSSSGLNQNQQQPQTNLPKNIQKQVQQQQMNQFASSEDYGSQSQGMDLTVDSVKLDEYDLVEEVQLVRKKYF